MFVHRDIEKLTGPLDHKRVFLNFNDFSSYLIVQRLTYISISHFLGIAPQHKINLKPLNDTFSGSATHFWGGYFRKVAYFQSHLRTRTAIAFVYITQIVQTTGKSF